MSAKHGTLSGYARGCRCADCKARNNAHQRERYRNTRQRTRRKPEHGSVTMYQKGCRCEPCVTRCRDYKRRWNQKHPWKQASCAEIIAGFACPECAAQVEQPCQPWVSAKRVHTARRAAHKATLPPRKTWQHGTASGYTKGCRCEPCVAANRAYKRQYYLASRRLKPKQTVSAANARRHIRWLATQGIGAKQLAIITGLGVTTILRIRDGERKRILAKTSEAILGVHLARALDTAWLPVERTRKLVGELNAAGWTNVRIAQALGLRRLELGRRVVSARRHRQIDALHERVFPDRRGSDGHGSDAGYTRHRRAGEEPCADCRAAHRRAHADRQERRGTAA